MESSSEPASFERRLGNLEKLLNKDSTNEWGAPIPPNPDLIASRLENLERQLRMDSSFNLMVDEDQEMLYFDLSQQANHQGNQNENMSLKLVFSLGKRMNNN